MSYFEAAFGETDAYEDLESLREEIELWVAAARPLSSTRELLVTLLILDYTAFSGWPARRGFLQVPASQWASLFKLSLANFLFSRSKEIPR